MQSLKSNILLLVLLVLVRFEQNLRTEEELVSVLVFRRFMLLLVVLDLVSLVSFSFIYQSILVAFRSGKMGEAA